jgi:hypothetical protein
MPDEQSTTQRSDAVPPGWQRLPDEPLPHPTYFPAGVAMGTAFMFWGLISNWVVLLVGVALFAAALAGWITDIRHGHKSH